jgi:3-oxoacyl-[acyl-carrier protein] reductase
VGKLDGKIALVTGGGRGIGRAIATKFVREGASVLLNDMDGDILDDVIRDLRSLGGDVKAVAGSVTEPAFAEEFIGKALQSWGELDIIVNNAGYTWDSVIQHMGDDQFDAMLDVHVRAPFRLLRAAASPFRDLHKRDEAAGRYVVRKVVNISSTSGTMGNAGQANYAAAKAAVIGLTKTLAKEWGRYKVTVNCVAFAYIQTRLTQAVHNQKITIDVGARQLNVGIPSVAIESLNRQIPLGRGGTPEEAAGAVSLFCFPESDYVSGQVLMCGGGFGSIG